MSKRSRILVGLAALVLLILAPVSLAVQGAPADSRLRWHTYAGSPTEDVAEGIAVDPAGNAYLTGWSDATWGSPILPYSGGQDAFVAKLSSTGELEWNTFVARYHPAIGYQAGAIAVDGSDAVYVVVTSPNAEGRPSALLLKLDPNGQLQWQRFFTTHGDQVGTSVAIDAAGNVYVGGWGGWLWDTPPVEPFPDRNGTFVAKLNSSGVEVWHALLGPWLGADDFTDCRTLAVDASGFLLAQIAVPADVEVLGDLVELSNLLRLELGDVHWHGSTTFHERSGKNEGSYLRTGSWNEMLGFLTERVSR